MAAAGLVIIGDVGTDGFSQWHLPLDEALERVRREWTALERDPWPGDIFWLLTRPPETRSRRRSSGTERVIEKEKETHPGFKRHTSFTHLGLSDHVAPEVHDDPTTATPTARDVTKPYGYDAFGLRLSFTNTPAITGSPGVGKAGTFTYAYRYTGKRTDAETEPCTS